MKLHILYTYMYSFISLWFILELSNLFVYIFDYLFINVLQEDMFFFLFLLLATQ